MQREGSYIDDRVRINEGKLNSYPYNCLCFLACCDENRKAWSFGTIVTISEMYGITAAHLLVRVTQ